MVYTKQIALCFLTYENLTQCKIWNKLVKDTTNKFNIYIHNKNDFTENETDFNKYIIKNKINTKWGNISLVNATLLLFKEAYENVNNKFFILLSDKCLPLFNLNVIYDKINKLNTNLIHVVENNNENKLDCFYNSLIDKSYFNKEDFKKQSQWMVLDRETVKFLINNDITNAVFGDNFWIPDEYYFINILIKNKINYINKSVTHVEWVREEKSCDWWIPYIYKDNDLEKIKEIIKKNNETDECLFIRKVSYIEKLIDYYNEIYNI